MRGAAATKNWVKWAVVGLLLSVLLSTYEFTALTIGTNTTAFTNFLGLLGVLVGIIAAGVVLLRGSRP